MKLLIDSNMAKLPRNCHECSLQFGGWCTFMPAEYDERCPDEDKPEWCPLSEVEEKTAHWEFDSDAYDWNLGAWVCSACRTVNSNLPVMNGVDDKNIYLFCGSRYCPECGAIMRRDNNGQTS